MTPDFAARVRLAALYLRWRTDRDREALSDLRRLVPLHRAAWDALPLPWRERRKVEPLAPLACVCGGARPADWRGTAATGECDRECRAQ